VVLTLSIQKASCNPYCPKIGKKEVKKREAKEGRDNA
jgi:hypothetical protein